MVRIHRDRGEKPLLLGLPFPLAGEGICSAAATLTAIFHQTLVALAFQRRLKTRGSPGIFSGLRYQIGTTEAFSLVDRVASRCSASSAHSQLFLHYPTHVYTAI